MFWLILSYNDIQHMKISLQTISVKL